MDGAATYRDLAESAWSWVLGQVREDDGPWLPDSVPDDDPDPAQPADDRDSLYAGIAGLAPALAEIARSRELTDTEQELRDRVVARLTEQAAVRVEPSLYDGLAGDATALRLLAPGAEKVALDRLAALATPDGWPTTITIRPDSHAPLTDIVMGTAGIVLAAIWADGEQSATIATTGCEALLAAADRTPAGLDWGMWPGHPARGPNYSHGTAGIATALAVTGAAQGRQDFVDAAVEGAQHLLDVGSLEDGGFVVPHTIPPSTREVEPVTYTWCHGPAGTSYLFAALGHAGVQTVAGWDVAELRERCLHSVLASGVPQRLRPGFWDNDGRCCGTAGVGEVLLDAAQDTSDPARSAQLLSAAELMGEALVERAIRDDDGARWRFVEYRQEPPLLPPGTSWMQGAAGIAAFLLRLSRVLRDGLEAPVVDRPDQWWAVPAGLLTVHAGAPR
ncbi:lanthionine synthetase LanC family protein [Angustibacter sp. McL0619]|uniref:lanthionine synthetase LanC family protein n=1 Tax=Angustibacter sp. McL0619 TaxID=3415676 RepID=UPI003CF513BF